MEIRKQIAIIFLLLLIGCKSNDSYDTVFYIGENQIESNCNFYEDENQTIFLSIDNKSNNKISNTSLKKIEIKIGKDLYNGLPINQFYSRENPDSDFIYAVDNKTKKPIITNIKDKYYIIVISEKTWFEDLVKEGVIETKLLD